MTEPSEIIQGTSSDAERLFSRMGEEGLWCGFLGYELCELTEEITPREPCDWNLPDIWFAQFRHQREFLFPSLEATPPTLGRVTASLSPSQHRRMLGRILDYLHAGDIYQANVTVRFEAEPVSSPWEVFLRLAYEAQAPFSAYIDSGDWKILSVSPELFLKLEENRLETVPIKGTVSRVSGASEDRQALQWLLGSEKNLSELLMIVDLERNDLGRVCETGSIRWGRFPETIALSNVYHLACSVSGTLTKGTSLSQIIKSTFPGGSVTGAPKRRALQILREIEPHRRGPYCGGIGFLSAGNVFLNLGIRTGVWKNDRLRFWGGGGIVVGHSVEEEQEEIRAKLKPFLDALGVSSVEFWRESKVCSTHAG